MQSIEWYIQLRTFDIKVSTIHYNCITCYRTHSRLSLNLHDQADSITAMLKAEALKQMHEGDDEILARVKVMEHYVETLKQAKQHQNTPLELS